MTDSTERSRRLAERARAVLPDGVTHDMRHLRPYPVYIDHATGSHKWDVDGNEYVDYWMGHGALLLGHRHPIVMAAISSALERATHPGGCHEYEVDWAEWVVKLVPSAERVRFTASGTEATMLALRLARAVTGRSRILKFEGHFHGWHDYATYGVVAPFDRPNSLGVPSELDAVVTVVRPGRAEVAAELERGDVAGVIIEPTGASMGVVPLEQGFLPWLRNACKRASSVLIFDEVISGFRFAPGGIQELSGVHPDLTALGKVLAGGLPGGAVAGRAEILDAIAFDYGDPLTWPRRVPHMGTFNASPPVAAAGAATLSIVASQPVCERAAELGSTLRVGLTRVIEARGAPWLIGGKSSVFHWLPGEGGRDADGASDSTQLTTERKAFRHTAASEHMRNALLRRGVDFPGYEGWLSAEHTEEDIEFTIDAFDSALMETEEACP